MTELPRRIRRRIADMLRFLPLERHLGELEAGYRARHRRGDARQMQWAIALYCSVLAAFAPLDAGLVGTAAVSRQMLLLRLVTVALLVLVGSRISRLDDARAIDRLALTAALLAVVATSAINATRPLDYTHFATIDAVFVFALYTMVPLPPRRRALPPLLLTAGDLALLFWIKVDLPPPALEATLIGLVAANVLGGVVSARIHGTRREQYLARLELERLASRDPLTGLLNRRSLLDRAEEAFRRHLVLGEPMTLALLDLDHFKSVNDRFGHLAGDDALRAFAQLLREERREGDLAGRLGGEEFVLLLPSARLGGGIQAAERVRGALRERPIEPRATDPPVTVSAGVAQARADDPGLDAVLLRADRALYRAKQLGRDRVEAEAPAPAAVAETTARPA